jgi:hypothetical protein
MHCRQCSSLWGSLGLQTLIPTAEKISLSDLSGDSPRNALLWYLWGHALIPEPITEVRAILDSMRITGTWRWSRSTPRTLRNSPLTHKDKNSTVEQVTSEDSYSFHPNETQGFGAREVDGRIKPWVLPLARPTPNPFQKVQKPNTPQPIRKEEKG